MYYSAAMNHGTACGGGGADQREGGERREWREGGGWEHAAFNPVGDPDGAARWLKSQRLGRVHVLELIWTRRDRSVRSDHLSTH